MSKNNELATIADNMLPSVADYIFEHASNVPDRIALASIDSQLSYGELANKVIRMAQAFLEIGLSQGDRVAVLTSPRVDAYSVFLSLNLLGVVWVGVNPVYQYQEMKHVLENSKPKALIFIDQFQGRQFKEDAKSLFREVDSIKHLFCLNRQIPDIPSLKDLASKVTNPSVESLPERDKSNIAMLVYTSGTTGQSKGAMIPNKAMVYRGLVLYKYFPVSDYPRVYCPLPLNHVGGMQLVSASALINGGTVNFREKFDADTVGEICLENRINFITMFPTMYQLIIESPNFDPLQFKSLECINYAGGTMSLELIGKLKKLGSGNVTTLFGSTETCSGVLFSELGLASDILTKSIGKMREGEARVINNNGELCKSGEIGEIQVPGEYCMAGYFNDEAATVSAFTEDGWLKLGDLAEVLPNGNLLFSARTSDMYKSGGYNVYPKEIEIALENHSSISTAVIVGVPDALYGEVGFAYLLRNSDMDMPQDELKNWLKGKVSNYKIPKIFKVIKTFPLLPNGKLDKAILKKMALDEVRTC